LYSEAFWIRVVGRPFAGAATGPCHPWLNWHPCSFSWASRPSERCSGYGTCPKRCLRGYAPVSVRLRGLRYGTMMDLIYCVSTPQADLLLHLPPIRVWFTDAMDARLANLWELRDLRLTRRQMLLTLSDYRPHVARVIWFRQRLAVRSDWRFFWGESEDEDE